MAKQSRRILLGTRKGLGGQERVYRTADYLEVDEVEHYEVRRKRIFYDEVLLVTLHSALAWPSLIASGLLAALFGAVSAALLMVETSLSLAFVFLTFMPFAALFVLHLVIRTEVVTVFGKRTRAQMRFWPRRSRARETYLRVCRTVRERQERARRGAVSPAATRPPDTRP